MITAQELALVAGVVISLAAFYLPVVGPWYEKLAKQAKAQVMGAVIVAVGVASFGLAYFCVGPLCLPQPVDLPNALWQLGVVIFSALVSNQSTYLLVEAAGNK